MLFYTEKCAWCTPLTWRSYCQWHYHIYFFFSFFIFFFILLLNTISTITTTTTTATTVTLLVEVGGEPTSHEVLLSFYSWKLNFFLLKFFFVAVVVFFIIVIIIFYCFYQGKFFPFCWVHLNVLNGKAITLIWFKKAAATPLVEENGLYNWSWT